MKKTQCCRWCRHAPAWEPAKDGRLLPNNRGACRWPWTSALPVVIGEAIPTDSFVGPDDGHDCPAFEWAEGVGK